MDRVAGQRAGDSHLFYAAIVQLYLIRHAIAVPHGTPGVADDDRPLTAKGIRRMRRVVRGLAALGIQLDEIWTSPLIRARHTAELVGEGLSMTQTPREVPALAPGGDPRMIGVELSERPENASIALVGHEPDMGTLAGWLLTGRAEPSLRFKKGGAACIEGSRFSPPDDAQLLWLLTPKQLAALADD
jgi:phosphohistidine phosphatase